jgi:hypothetical protein
MSVNDQSAAPRRFVASTPPMSRRWSTGMLSYIWVLGVMAVFVAVLLLAKSHGLNVVVAFVPVVVPTALLAGYFFWRSRRPILVDVTGEGLTVSRRRGDLYSLVDAELGPWETMGIALHLHSGRHRFVLGGRDRRVSPTTPLNAPPVQAVDAWLSDSDFDELLSAGGRAAARGPAPGEPSRCLLFRDVLIKQIKRKKVRQQLLSDSHPQLFFDIDGGAIRVADPHSDAINASASLSQVTAAPGTYVPGAIASNHGVLVGADDLGEVLAENAVTDAYENAMVQAFNTTPLIVVTVPGLEQVTIGCRDFVNATQRFSWRGAAPKQGVPAAYVVSSADWLLLTEKLGLAASLIDIKKK